MLAIVESDAGLFTCLMENLGVRDIQCEELLTLDPIEMFTLKPLYGLIFLFKYPTDQPYASASGPVDGAFDHESAQDMFFAAQTIQNACGTQALLSVLLNRMDLVDVGGALREFRDFSMPLPPEFRGEVLSNSELIREEHNSFSRSSPFADETRKTGEAEDAFHFIAYVPVNGTLYELDGLQPAPISHGPCDEDDFHIEALDVIRKRIARYEMTELRFNLMAICRDVRLWAKEYGDDMVLEKEERKRQDRLFENALRRHNFVGLAGEVVKEVVRGKLKRGGEQSYSSWLNESTQRRHNEDMARRR